MSVQSKIHDDLVQVRGNKSIGRQDLPLTILMDVRDIIEDSDVFVGHISDKIKEGSHDATFAVTPTNLLCAAIALISDVRATDVEKQLLTMELIGLARTNEDIIDVEAIVKAISDASEKIRIKMQEFQLFDEDVLNYVFGRFENGQLELVRKTIDDSELDFTKRGFTIPSWADPKFK